MSADETRGQSSPQCLYGEIDPQDLIIETVNRHSRFGKRLAVVGGTTSSTLVEVVFQICEGRISRAEFHALSQSLPRDGALNRGALDFSLRCRVGFCESELSRAGATVYQAVAFLGVESRPRPGLTLCSSYGEGPVKLEDKSLRHRILAQWMLAEFGGVARLGGSNDFVLEVAGGRGLFADALTRQGVSVTVVDPRAPSPDQTVGDIPAALSDCEAEANLVGTACNLVQSVKPIEFFEALDSTGQILPDAHSDDVEGDSEVHEVPCMATLKSIKEVFDGNSCASLVTQCSALVALHPDEATEAAIDAALAAKKPFAIVPCCVFPRLFPSRRLRCGQGVSGYVGLLRYLREKDVRIRAVRLPFQGRNIALFMTADDYSRAAPDVDPGCLRAPLWQGP